MFTLNLQGVYSLEKMRQDHDEDIADVFYSATIAIWSLHHLAKLTIETDMLSKFESILKKVEQTLSDFGQYVIDYYSKNKAVRLITIHGASSALEAFRGEFDGQKVELQWFLDTHTAVSTQRGLNLTQNKLDKLVNKMESQSDTMKKVAENYRKGREQLNQMQDNFNAQFTNILDTIKQSNAETRDAIIKRLDEGPHELIIDESMKLVWKDMRWRNTVKCRHFLDAVQDSFFTRFATLLKSTSNYHQDQWTMTILSKSIFYPGVGDAIDADSTGFVSVTQLNNFLAMRPDGWSVPEWLSFWAVGWAQCNMTYRVRIHDKWNEITEKTSSLVTTFGPDHAFSQFIAETEQFIKNVVGVAEEDYEEEILGADAEAELHRLNTKYRRLQEQMLGDQLANTIIQEQADVINIIGQPRIELSLLPLIYMWLTYFAGKVDATAGEDNVALLATEFTLARKTLEAMVSRRLGELVQIWSQQKEHLPTQVAGFCSGIFESYYDNVFQKVRAEKRAKKLKTY
ncbi:hypothetical protein BXZ70DRAFT_912936 [Cristinia sonorae]|uniref:EF-hand domain-containing protein n=1 Tax=Cristinia sonorae TaxID=1940300 RepID=A0A8K0XVU8_9AGAR|nr:hypothetical protein BXZ70DRAFT_912936 [Cristinia sonorae]